MHQIKHHSSGMEDAISRSLERSAAYGVNPHLDGASEATRLSPDLLAARIKKQREFYDPAVEQIDTLYRLLAGTGFCMVLADAAGYVLYVQGDADLVEYFKNRRCVPGYRWTERDMGTCAIGLALAARIPIFLPGSKMYCKAARNYSNAGAPIFSPNGRAILGAVSLSGESCMMHVHTLGLVRQAAETVTTRLRESLRARELAVKTQYLRALIDSDSRGIVTVNPRGQMVEANRNARKLLCLPDNLQGLPFENYAGEGCRLEEHLKAGKGFKSREIMLRQGKASHFASLDPIHMQNGESAGGLLTILEKKEMMRMAVEVSGTQAHFTFDSILGESVSLREALRHARIAAGGSAPLLLSGETGTGKELFAQAVHNASERCKRPFVVINCGAIPKELLESELFGYEEGAFTGARRGGRPGKFELADTGTLLLDEIGDMPFDMQVKLLRVLQSGEIQRVGGLRSMHVDIRIISATNKDLKQAIREHQFREDLYYRISTLHITVPPLRERPQDIPLLATHFIRRHETRLKRPPHPLLPETLRAILRYAWPGNIRQLESAVERAMSLAEGKALLPEHFGIPTAPETTYLAENGLAVVERKAVAETLARYKGNICRTASALGISRPTLYRKLKAMGLKP